ncbi:MAG: type I phosphomannose isomerase catalytic subunit [Massilia sp.]
MTLLYPFKFAPIFKDKIWGGQKIDTYLGKNFAPLPNCGESWEISGVRSAMSMVANGALEGHSLASLLARYQGALVGRAVYQRFGDEFPLLVKFIDAADDLSVQAHPGDELARQRHGCFGKTEMWYVVQADEGATLVSGFKRKIDPQIYLDKVAAGRLCDILNVETAAAGDVFFLPAGRVHTIGKGLLIAEIQQASDVTYRIYDFDRVDGDGKPRALHTEEALAALDYDFHDDYKLAYSRTANAPVKLVACEHFRTNILTYTQAVTRDYSFDSFVIHVCVQGSYTLNYRDEAMDIEMGECVLIPAAIASVTLSTQTGYKILESYIV